MKRFLLLLAATSILLSACAAPDEYVDVPVSTPAASAPSAAPTASPVPTEKPLADQNADKIKEAKAKNSDVIGWVNVPDTNIDYPIMYGDDWYYHYHNFEKERENERCVYAYREKAARNNPVTAPNLRESGTMFHQLHQVQDDAERLLTYGNRVWNISVFGHEFWEVFALYEAPAGEPKETLYFNTQTLADADDDELENWLGYQMSRSEIALGVQPSMNDTFLTLVTCGDTHEDSNKNSRLYVFLRAVD
ncbi:MAG: class B sortase [Bacillota bacterium]